MLFFGQLAWVHSFSQDQVEWWNIRRMGEQKREKKDLILELSYIDNQAETRELLLDEWAYRYQLERQLENLYLEEEIY
jgi:hypothetical protein